MPQLRMVWTSELFPVKGVKIWSNIALPIAPTLGYGTLQIFERLFSKIVVMYVVMASYPIIGNLIALRESHIFCQNVSNPKRKEFSPNLLFEKIVARQLISSY